MVRSKSRVKSGQLGRFGSNLVNGSIRVIGSDLARSGHGSDHESGHGSGHESGRIPDPDLGTSLVRVFKYHLGNTIPLPGTGSR